MKEYPIIFSTDMVKAILDGRKTMTRRVIKFRTEDAHRIYRYVYPHPNGGFSFQDYTSPTGIPPIIDKTGKLCPYGQVGDRLWVRETFHATDIGHAVHYKTREGEPDWMKWSPSIHMPRWASRITLEITELRVERLQEITGEDVNGEGVIYDDLWGKFSAPDWDAFVEAQEKVAIQALAKFWNSINAKRGYGWETNPWVWVISFKKI